MLCCILFLKDCDSKYGHTSVSLKMFPWESSVWKFSVLNAANVQDVLKRMNASQAHEPQKVFPNVVTLDQNLSHLFLNLD